MNASARNGTVFWYLQNPDRGFDSHRRLSVFVGVFAKSELADDRLTPTVDANPDRNRSKRDREHETHVKGGRARWAPKTDWRARYGTAKRGDPNRTAS